VRAKGKKGLSVRSEDEPQINSFFAAQSKIRIRRGETKQLVVQFMPVSMEPHRCKIIFVDNAVGEFQHELVGEVALPEVSGEVKPTQIYVDQTIESIRGAFNSASMRDKPAFSEAMRDGQ